MLKATLLLCLIVGALAVENYERQFAPPPPPPAYRERRDLAVEAEHNDFKVPVFYERTKRQFGFGGSGAQAGASSFGGGFGGAPGFGGGFSGSQANAGAGSFGGGFGR